MEGKLKVGEEFTSEKGNKYVVKKLLATGGQGESYEVEINNKQYFLKWYYSGAATEEKLSLLQRMIDEKKPGEDFIWPIDIIKAHDSYGCICTIIPSGYYTFGDMAKQKVNPSFAVLCKVGEQLAYNLELLHSKDYVLLAEYDYLFEPLNGKVLIPIWEKIKKKDENLSFVGVARLTAHEVVRGEARQNIKSDYYVLALYIFYLFMVGHPLEGKKEYACKCMDMKAMQSLYGDNPIFIYDKENDSNRPVPGYHDNVIIYWNLYPEYFQEMFHRVFSNGCKKIQERPTEKEWIDVLERLGSDIVECSCGAEVFVEKGTEKICWNCKSVVKNLIRKKNNCLADIVERCPDVIYDRKKLMAYLMDFMPEDKVIRNVICLSFDEKIPQDIYDRKTVGKMEFQQYKKRLINSFAVADEIATKVVTLWIDAICTDASNEIWESELAKNDNSANDTLDRASFWQRFSFENIIKLNKSNIIVMDTGKFCIVESIQPEGPTYIFDKKVYTDKVEYWLTHHNNSECRIKLWNFKHLAKKVFVEKDKQHPEIIDKYIIDNWIANHIRC